MWLKVKRLESDQVAACRPCLALWPEWWPGARSTAPLLPAPSYRRLSQSRRPVAPEGTEGGVWPQELLLQGKEASALCWDQGGLQTTDSSKSTGGSWALTIFIKLGQCCSTSSQLRVNCFQEYCPRVFIITQFNHLFPKEMLILEGCNGLGDGVTDNYTWVVQSMSSSTECNPKGHKAAKCRTGASRRGSSNNIYCFAAVGFII